MKQGRRWVPVAVVALAVAAIAMRIAVAVAGGQSITDESGLTAFDVALVCIGVSIGGLMMAFGLVK